MLSYKVGIYENFRIDRLVSRTICLGRSSFTLCLKLQSAWLETIYSCLVFQELGGVGSNLLPIFDNRCVGLHSISWRCSDSLFDDYCLNRSSGLESRDF